MERFELFSIVLQKVLHFRNELARYCGISFVFHRISFIPFRIIIIIIVNVWLAQSSHDNNNKMKKRRRRRKKEKSVACVLPRFEVQFSMSTLVDYNNDDNYRSVIPMEMCFRWNCCTRMHLENIFLIFAYLSANI